MQVKTIIQEIQQLSLRKRFLIIEETLKSIKKEELKNEHKVIFDDSDDVNAVHSMMSINEKSLAKDWLSEEDNRWDKIL